MFSLHTKSRSSRATDHPAAYGEWVCTIGVHLGEGAHHREVEGELAGGGQPVAHLAGVDVDQRVVVGGEVPVQPAPGGHDERAVAEADAGVAGRPDDEPVAHHLQERLVEIASGGGEFHPGRLYCHEPDEPDEPDHSAGGERARRPVPRTIDWAGDHLLAIDQTLLPDELRAGAAADDRRRDRRAPPPRRARRARDRCGRWAGRGARRGGRPPGRPRRRLGARRIGTAARRPPHRGEPRVGCRPRAGSPRRRPRRGGLVRRGDARRGRRHQSGPRRSRRRARALAGARPAPGAGAHPLQRRWAGLRASGGRRSASSAPSTRRAICRRCSPTRRGRCCRAPGSPRGSWPDRASTHRVVVDGAGAHGDRPGSGRRGDRRCRPDRRQRRRGQQDRHLPAGAGRGHGPASRSWSPRRSRPSTRPPAYGCRHQHRGTASPTR